MLKQNLTNLYGQLEGCRSLILFDVVRKSIVESLGDAIDPNLRTQQIVFTLNELNNFLKADPANFMKGDYLAVETTEDIYYMVLSEAQNMALLVILHKDKTRLPIVRTIVERAKKGLFNTSLF